MIEELITPRSRSPLPAFQKTQRKNQQPTLLDYHQVEKNSGIRISTGIEEFNRVLGGGLVSGSYILLGGAPGIGKSTLLLQIAEGLSLQKLKIFYISAEESVQQTCLRAERLSIKNNKQIFLLNETSLEKIFHHVENIKPDILIIDSIQTVQMTDLPSPPGTVSQVCECSRQLMNFAKSTQTAVFIIGHITKEGQLAGPRLLEHMVDTVLSFDGDPHHQFRLLRALKNRFGATNEIGVFQMLSTGLKEVSNPSEFLLEDRGNELIGSVIFTTMEGSRPLLCEIQALVLPSYLPMPRRTSIGLDINRLHMIVAVLDRYLDTKLSQCDIFLNLVGGLKISEPGADVAIAKALISAKKHQTIHQLSCFFGEIGLTGEVRACTFSEERIREAKKLGFKNIQLPEGNKKHINKNLLQGDVKLKWIRSIKDLA